MDRNSIFSLLKQRDTVRVSSARLLSPAFLPGRKIMNGRFTNVRQKAIMIKNSCLFLCSSLCFQIVLRRTWEAGPIVYWKTKWVSLLSLPHLCSTFNTSSPFAAINSVLWISQVGIRVDLKPIRPIASNRAPRWQGPHGVFSWYNLTAGCTLFMHFFFSCIILNSIEGPLQAFI